MPAEAQRNAAPDMVLTATLSDVTGLANLLKSVSIQTHAVVIASSSGLEIVTELNRTLQAHAYLYSHMFDTYQFQTPSRDAPSSSQSNAARARPKKRAKAQGRQDHTSDVELSASSSSDAEDARTQATGLSTDDSRRKRSRNAEDRGDHGAAEDEPDSVSFEVSLQTWISCLNIFGGVGPSRPHGTSSGHPGSRSDAGAGTSAGGRGYTRTRDGTVDPYGADRGGSVERGFDRNQPFSSTKATRMKLSYQGHGNPLVLELEQEANVLTRVSISTYEPSFLTDMIFDPRNMVAQVIVGSELMQSAFSEIDPTCKKLSILMTSPHSAYDDGDIDESSRAGKTASMLRFKALTDTGSSEMEFPASLSSADPTGVIEKFVAVPGSSEQWYDFTLLSRTMTVLRSSIKTSMRMDEAGLISFQFMMPKYRRTAGAGAAAGQGAAEEEQDAFCEFLCCPLDTSTMIV